MADHLELQVYVERTAHDAETALEELIERGELNRVDLILQRLEERLKGRPK